ncbi:MAG TPA: DUF11 domain-containing protein [Myxococcales bacterium]
MKLPEAFVAILALAACGGTALPQARGSADIVAAAGPLALSMGPAAPLVEGTSTAYAMTVTNTTAAAMNSVTFSASFPQSTINQIPASCVRIGGGQPEIICSVASIAPGASVSFDTQVRPNVAGTLTYTCGAAASGSLLNLLDDVEAVSPAPTDVQVTGSASSGAPPLGSAFTYTFQVKNDGPYPSFGGVTFSDVLPSSLTFLAVSTSAGTCAGGASVSCALGDLAVGGQATIQISVRAPAVAQSVADTASVSIGAQADRNPANDSVSITVTPK